ncbi:hypothetical protein BKA67DRAFT_585990 [Truncatella angustata]|uniref:Uncharacterized protein n=1 Tax=Truncatella angustata TaxID=152316 RepID=A0A9P8RGN3_9PEZI|nr:uncharacterized protein BKA67DRAFT_585990 [Truncatella angustata]KAH6645648.1 hypothetical protein BKA67DRAFT_585990 [Truncatella angustata]
MAFDKLFVSWSISFWQDNSFASSFDDFTTTSLMTSHMSVIPPESVAGTLTSALLPSAIDGETTWSVVSSIDSATETSTTSNTDDSDVSFGSLSLSTAITQSPALLETSTPTATTHFITTLKRPETLTIMSAACLTSSHRLQMTQNDSPHRHPPAIHAWIKPEVYFWSSYSLSNSETLIKRKTVHSFDTAHKSCVWHTFQLFPKSDIAITFRTHKWRSLGHQQQIHQSS